MIIFSYKHFNNFVSFECLPQAKCIWLTNKNFLHIISVI